MDDALVKGEVVNEPEAEAEVSAEGGVCMDREGVSGEGVKAEASHQREVEEARGENGGGVAATAAGVKAEAESRGAQKTKHTSKEILIYSAMTCPMSQLMTSYESNPFEFMPSRFLSLIPHPLKPLIEGALTTCLEDIELFGDANKLIQSVPASLTTRAAQPATLKAANPTSRRLLSDQVMESFTHVSKLTPAAMLQACDKGPNVTVTKISDVFPDHQLVKNQYAAAQASENLPMEPHSFLIVSSNSQHCCLYKQSKPPSDGPKLAKHDLYGTPQEMVTIQITASQAPKRWLCLRRSKEEPRKAFVTEIGGKRVAIQRDRGLSAEHNSALHLRVDKRKS